MNYLFFDVECAKCEKGGVGHICEFGYVITDHKFNILSQNHIMINPDCEFDKHALKNILNFTKEEYGIHPKFPEFYEQIKNILTAPEQKIIGHTTQADHKYINSQCKRYKLPRIEFSFYDITIPYKKLLSNQLATGLEKMVSELEIEISGQMHSALTDAIATMLVCKTLTQKFNKTLEELLSIKESKSHLIYSSGDSNTTIGEIRKSKIIK